MEKHLDKKLDELTNRMMQDSSLEKPSFNFTDAVMQKIEIASKNKITDYKPLISKPIWGLISLSFFVVLYMIVSTSTSSDSTFFNTLNFDTLFDNQITKSFSSVSFSKTVMYTITLFGLMLCVQIPILKNYFDKRFEV